MGKILDRSSIGEINVRGIASGIASVIATATPLSRTGWTATASHSAAGTNPSDALDGALSTRWSDGVAQVGTEWFQVDMGTSKTFNRVRINPAGNLDNANGDYPRGYEIYVSNGSGWTLVAAGSGASNVVDVTFPTVSARYVNVHETGTSSDHFWSLSELNVFS